MMPWRRHRRSRPTLDARAQADAWQAISLLLDYPDERTLALLPPLRETTTRLPDRVSDPLEAFMDDLEARDLAEVQSEYVDTFDWTRKCALHLTYALHGDTRRRGAALVQFRQAYRHAGAELADEGTELPDHLCVLLEFGASAGADTAWRLLNDHRVSIELLHAALVSRSSAWLPLVQALRATLPDLKGDDEQALAALIAEGPPQEDVGLDNAPYALDPATTQQQDLGRTIPVGAPR